MQAKYDKNSTPIQNKNAEKNRNRGELPQLAKEHVQKPTASIVLNGNRLKANEARMSTLTVHS